MRFLKSKEFLYVILIILIIVSAVVLFFYPNLIDKKYPYSYENVVIKRDIVESNNLNLSQNETGIISSLNELEDIKIRKQGVESEALEVRKGIKKSDFELNISSMLISLEQRSYENNVDLIIDYTSILNINGSDNMNNYEEELTEHEEELTEHEEKLIEHEEKLIEHEEENNVKKGIDVEIKEPQDETDDNEELLEPMFSEEEIQRGSIQIDGINITVVPITVTGSYYNVRNYIKYLDKIGMIEPSTVTLTSEGKTVVARLMLNVFHGEVDL